MQTLWERHCREQKVSASTSPLLIPPRLLSPASVVHLQQAYFLSLSLFRVREMKVRRHQMFECAGKQQLLQDAVSRCSFRGFYGLLNLWRATAAFLTVTVTVWRSSTLTSLQMLLLRSSSIAPCLSCSLLLAIPHCALFFLLIYWQWNEQRMVLNSEWNFCK